MTISNCLRKVYLSCLPAHALSRFAGLIANSQRTSVKNYAIDYFIRRFHPNMAEALIEDPHQYASYNDFFTRQLKPDLRQIAGDEQVLACPIDGFISQFGNIEQNSLIQAKGKSFALPQLVANSDAAKPYENGSFITLYLSPSDYHRVHIPTDGQLLSMHYVPGRLFPVNPASTTAVTNLFARNERVICHFETEQGPLAVIMVGAMLVGSISTSWQGKICPDTRVRGKIQSWQYAGQAVVCRRGDEMGCFHFGSTVILLTHKRINWDPRIKIDAAIKLGQALGSL